MGILIKKYQPVSQYNTSIQWESPLCSNTRTTWANAVWLWTCHFPDIILPLMRSGWDELKGKLLVKATVGSWARFVVTFTGFYPLSEFLLWPISNDGCWILPSLPSSISTWLQILVWLPFVLISKANTPMPSGIGLVCFRMGTCQVWSENQSVHYHPVINWWCLPCDHRWISLLRVSLVHDKEPY